MNGQRVVVVGHGMAGARLVSELVDRDRSLRITVFGDEPHEAYNRILLSNVVAGKAELADIVLPPTASPTRAGVELRSGVAVSRIDRAARTVYADDGSQVEYDVLVLATGAAAWLPPIGGLRRDDGSLLPGVTAFRTLDDCRAIVESAGTATAAVVLGGGLLGLEAARGLARRGLPVTVLHGATHVMNRQLDAGAGRVLDRTLHNLGVAIRTDVQCTRIVDVDGRFSGVELASGEVVAADLLVVSTGVAPNVALAADAGLPVATGVVVDDQLRSPADPDVFALGDCAEHRGLLYGLVAPAWEQAKVVADVVTGADPDAHYPGSKVVTRLKAIGVDLAAMGDIDADEFSDDVEVIQFIDHRRGTFKKVVIRDDRLVGAILLGENATVGTVTQLFDRGTPVPADRRALLFASLTDATKTDSPATLPDRVTICQCNNVTKGAITKCWLNGARSLATVVDRTRATTGCGTCRDQVAGIVEWLAASDPADDDTDSPAGTPATESDTDVTVPVQSPEPVVLSA